MKVAVILPSRGLIFSQTAEEVLTNLKGIDHKIFFAHKLPIPNCFEVPVSKALEDPSFTHIWLVEDDMCLKPDTLSRMLEADKNAVAYDYPVTKEGNGAVFYDQGGNAVFAGTGCLLIKRKVFNSLKKPYFTDKVRWNLQNYGESIKMTGVYADTGYGTHDITFCVKLWNSGITLNVLKGNLAQRKLIALGKAGTNNGAHSIEVWRKVTKNKRLRALLSQPIAQGAKTKLVTVDTPTGGVTVSRTHAENLVKQGMASYPPRRYTIIDDSEVDI